MAYDIRDGSFHILRDKIQFTGPVNEKNIKHFIVYHLGTPVVSFQNRTKTVLTRYDKIFEARLLYLNEENNLPFYL